MTITPVQLAGQRIVITGATGFVAQPIVAALAAENEVFAVARYANAADKDKVAATGAHALTLDIASGDMAQLPDADYVLNLAVAKTQKWPVDMAVNAEAVGRLIKRYQNARAFLHFSSTGVYQYAGHEPCREDSPLGDNHRNLFETYSISKIAGEAVATFAAHSYGVPTTIARLNVPYGPFPCWPYFHLMMMQNGMAIDIHPDGPNAYNPIHSSDYIEKIPHLLAAAVPEVTTVNLAGSEPVSIEQWCGFMGELTGLTPVFNRTEKALGNLTADTAKMESIAGATKVHWQEGMRQMLQVMVPDALK